MTEYVSIRTERRILKQMTRRVRNHAAKVARTAARRVELIEGGKTVIVTETDGVKTYALPPTPKIVEPPTPNKLSWLGGKQHSQQGDSRKNRSGVSPEHRLALVENASRTFAVEIEKALKSEIAPDVMPIIGEFADRDPAQGAAIDHAIATGEGLFA